MGISGTRGLGTEPSSMMRPSATGRPSRVSMAPVMHAPTGRFGSTRAPRPMASIWASQS